MITQTLCQDYKEQQGIIKKKQELDKGTAKKQKEELKIIACKWREYPKQFPMILRQIQEDKKMILENI